MHHTESFDQSRQQSRLVSSASKALSTLLPGSLVTSCWGLEKSWRPSPQWKKMYMLSISVYNTYNNYDLAV